MKNYYDILGINKTASSDEIKKAYKKQARAYHPDLNKDPGATTKFNEISEAYSVLSDDESRRQYDLYGKVGKHRTDFADVFSNSFFEDFFHPKEEQRFNVNPNIEAFQEITFLESIFGCKKEVNIVRYEFCNDCGGNGSKGGNSLDTCNVCGGRGMVSNRTGFFVMNITCPNCGGKKFITKDKCTICWGHGLKEDKVNKEVDIPSGVFDSVILRVPGMGNCYSPNRYGDLLCRIKVQPHELFFRENRDIICKIPISYNQAVLGEIVEIPAFDMDLKKVIKHKLQLSELTEYGKEFIISKCNSGNYIARIQICMPDEATDDYKKFLSNNKLGHSIINRFGQLIRDMV